MKKAKRTYLEPENPKRIEHIILAVYLFCTLTVPPVILRADGDAHAILLLSAAAPFVLYMHIRQKQSYVFRACVVTVLLWMHVSILALHTNDFPGLFTSIGALTLLLALYGLPQVFSIGSVFYTTLVLLHVFLLRDIFPGFNPEGMRVLTHIFSIYLIEALARYLVRTQQASRRHLMENIESLHRMEHSKDDFMANVSHEIRTPVNTICGMSEIVLQGELPPETRSYMYNIQTAGRNLLSIVSDILDFSELESGNISILEDSYFISSVVNDIVSTANAKNSEKHLELIVDCDPAMPETLVGDRQKICRAVINVIDNAIKFTQEGGVVFTISTRQENYGVNLCITVEDTGIGIKPEVLEKIFTSFNQANTRRNRAENGIGLGLAISKAIINKMGGFLKISSVYGEGTRVRIVIPQKVEDAAPCAVVRDAQEKRILVYLHLNQNKFPLLREGSQTAITHMAARFDVTAFACRNLSDVKRRAVSGEITHLFIGWEEYNEDPAYFKEIAGQIQVTLILDCGSSQELPEGDIFCINPPLYALSVASILNGETVQDIHKHTHQHRFTAPDVHVLVVDDSLMNLKVVEGLLRPYRLKVSTAQSGQEALKMLRSKAFDFIFMDHMMPGMDGVETFRHIREKKDSYYQSVPIIALTANAVGNAREMFLAEGFSDYLSKPIEMSALEHILRKFIPRGKMEYAEKALPAGQAQTAAKAAKAPALSGQPGHEPDPEEADVTDRLAAGGIDVSLGVTYCGGMDEYLEILRIYCADGEETIRRIREAYADGDWKSYVILTHTMKSTSKSIGAAALSELAKELEAAGRSLASEKGSSKSRSDTKTPEGTVLRGSALHPELAGRTEEMLAEYARILDVLRHDKAVFPEGPSAPQTGQIHETPPENREPGKEELPTALKPEGNTPGSAELTPEQFADCCGELARLLDSFDSESVTAYLEALGGQMYGGTALAARFAPVRAFVDDFDFMGAADALDQIKRSSGT